MNYIYIYVLKFYVEMHCEEHWLFPTLTRTLELLLSVWFGAKASFLMLGVKFLASPQRHVFYFPIVKANKYLQYQQLKLQDMIIKFVYWV